jgi:hypothetical protein
LSRKEVAIGNENNVTIVVTSWIWIESRIYTIIQFM